MSASAIAKRYARALVSLGDEEGAVDRFQAALARIDETFGAAPELVSVLADPAYSAEAKRSILEEVLEKLDVPATVKSFMLLLQNRNRLAIFPQIVQTFGALADERAGIVRARVTAARELTPDQLAAVRGALSQLASGKRVELAVDLDPAIIGGLVTRIGDMVFDGSVRSELERIEDTLTKG